MRPSLLPILLSSKFSPSSLFAAGEQGVWYEPGDFSTLFQDSAATTPVTAVGQPVGKMLDKSGRGNHASQATAGSRPTLQVDSTGRYYLSFDGLASSMSAAAINFGVNQLTVACGLSKSADAAAAILFEFSTNLGGFNGAFQVLAPTGAAAGNVRLTGKGTATASTTQTVAVGETVVFSALADIGQPRIASRKNGNYNGQDAATTMGTGTFGNFQLYLGGRGGTTLLYSGRLYPLVVRGAMTDAQLPRLERWVTQRTGV